MIQIWGDFNNQDENDLVRLDSVGSLADIKKFGTKLHNGLRVRISDGDLEADGILEFTDGIWRAKILWETRKDLI